MDLRSLERLVETAAPGADAGELLDRLDRTVRRRVRWRRATQVVAVVSCLLVAAEVATMPSSRPVPTIAAGPAECEVPRGGVVRRAAAGALAAVALAGCTGPEVTDAPSDEGAVLEVRGDDGLGGTHRFGQIEPVFFEPVEDEDGQHGYGLLVEMLDDDFDRVRLTGDIEPDGTPRVHVEVMRIDGERFEGPGCDVTVTDVPPGRFAGTFTCASITDLGGDVTVDVEGEWVVPDLRPRGTGRIGP